eukprot:4598376-Amphidinium_carterae.1
MAGVNTSSSFVPGSTSWFTMCIFRCVRTEQMRKSRRTSGRSGEILGLSGGLRVAKVTLDLLLQTDDSVTHWVSVRHESGLFASALLFPTRQRAWG